MVISHDIGETFRLVISHDIGETFRLVISHDIGETFRYERDIYRNYSKVAIKCWMLEVRWGLCRQMVNVVNY